MIFEIDNIELNYSETRILNGIYLKLETGTVTGILGRNGCGKSSLLQIIFGSLSPKYKLIKIDGIRQSSPLYKKDIAKLLPQETWLPHHLTVIKIFELFRVSWSSFIASFAMFEKQSNIKFGNLSGGEQRVIETYLILKSKAKLVLLDEPFSQIAPIYVNLFKEVIVQEKKDKAILITDHMYEHILSCSDSLYLLKNGCTKLIENISELEDYQYLREGSLSKN